MAQVVIIADDLTGALDSASAFAGRGLSTRVSLSLGEFELALGNSAIDVVAFVTGTREQSASAASSSITSAVSYLSDYNGIIFKKIDSRMKGHVAVELSALRVRFPLPVLASPAVPVLGRFTCGGAVIGAGVTSPIDVAAILGCEAAIPDVASDGDFDSVLPARLEENLYVGAAGLGSALARRLAPEGQGVLPQLPSPLLLAIGSRDPITLAQVAQAPIDPVLAPNGAIPVQTSDATRMFQLTQGDEKLAGPEAARRFAVSIAMEMRRSEPRSLFGCGGETAHAILRELGIQALDLLGEVLPGVPVSRCPRTGLVLLSKSGGFGAPDLIKVVLREFDKFSSVDITTD